MGTKVAEKGDVRVLETLCGCLGDPTPDMRYKGLLALPSMVQTQNHAISLAVARLLEDTNADVRRAALDVLLALDVAGQECIIDALRRRFEDRSVIPNERRAAMSL